MPIQYSRKYFRKKGLTKIVHKFSSVGPGPVTDRPCDTPYKLELILPFLILE